MDDRSVGKDLKGEFNMIINDIVGWGIDRGVCSGVGRGVGDKVEIILVIKLEKELN